MNQTKRLGNWVLKGYAQKMADGTWGSCCVISDYRGPSFYDGMLVKDGPYFPTEVEAANVGLEKGLVWLNENFPIS